MGTTLELVVPEDEQTERTIQEYYNFVESKSRETRPDWPQEAHESTGNPELVLERYHKEGVFYMYEKLYKEVVEEMDWEQVRELFNLEESWHQCIINDADEIRELIRLIETSKKKLVEKRPAEENWNHSMETGVIALCEFALENDYRIELHLG